MKILVGLILALLLVAVGFYFERSFVKESPIPKEEKSENQTPEGMPKKETGKDTIINGVFTSEELGIKFKFALKDTETEQEFFSKRVGNTVYVYPKGMDVEGGQFVTVFSKDPNEPLEEAIKRLFLQGYSDKDCEVLTDRAVGHPSSFVRAEIAYVDDIPFYDAGVTVCPIHYSQTNGIRYFLMDSNHPDKFVFLSIGQYGIPANDGQDDLWQETLEFL